MSASRNGAARGGGAEALRSARLAARDVLRTALLGPRTRPLRAALSALGVGVGVAALAAITTIAATDRAALLAALDAMGADLVVVTPGHDQAGAAAPLPETAAGTLSRLDRVERVGTVRTVPGEPGVYRSDLVPRGQKGGLSALAADPRLAEAIEARLVAGRWFDETTRDLPVAVLGAVAAERLGVRPGPGGLTERVWIGGRWYAVLGVLAPVELAAGIDTTAFLPDRWVAEHLVDPVACRAPSAGAACSEVAAVYLRAEAGAVADVAGLAPAAANPAAPGHVEVTTATDLVAARAATDSSLGALGAALAGIGLVIGGIGIANTMVVVVLERRGEIGLRLALGARSGQVATQFVLEAVLIGATGGVVGTALGVAAGLARALWTGTVPVVDQAVVLAGPAVAAAVGALAGWYPAARAARLPPTDALRTA